MKKKAFLAGILVFALLAAYFVGCGFLKNGAAYVEDYAVSEDGSVLTLRLASASSVGCLRKVTVHQQQGGKLYLDCYAAFGGINGSIGARDTFTFELEDDTSVVGLYRAADCYETVLVKCEDGSWQRSMQ